MKKIAKPVLFGVILLACLFVINTGCKKKAECSGEVALCPGHVFEACCTDSDCYYIVDGDQQYDCDGLSCGPAAAQIVDDYCVGAFGLTEKQALETVQKVLAAVK
jgi:hypothetical protein